VVALITEAGSNNAKPELVLAAVLKWDPSSRSWQSQLEEISPTPFDLCETSQRTDEYSPEYLLMSSLR